MQSDRCDIVLSTLNARYAHAAFGLRYLLANLGELQGRARILEFDISQRPVDVLERILACEPKIVGLGVYIWNVALSTVLAAQLKRVRPDVVLVAGGPEVSHETDQQEITRYADYVITGEGDLAFASLCRKLLAGERPPAKIIAAPLPEFEERQGTKARRHGGTEGGEKEEEGSQGGSLRVLEHGRDGRATGGRPVDGDLSGNWQLTPGNSSPSAIQLPYSLYTAADIAHRVVYVEASRGCPFKCEFCLSSLDVPVRNVPLDAFVIAMQDLLDRGLMQFKFVDRTFNLNLKISSAILEFFLARWRPGMFLHFEMIPDRLPEGLRALIAKFEPGALQFEVGIQTFNEAVAARISRKQDNAKVEENLRFLREQTGVHVHADLIAGLPGEDVESFAAGFDRLVAMRPQEIQVGILKRLRGTPIARHDQAWEMVYSPHAPYEILQTKLIDFATMQRVRRFARFWDLLANSGNFRDTLPRLWAGGSAFARFLELSDRLHERLGRSHGIALQDLAEFLFTHLVERLGQDRGEVARSIWADYQRGGRSDRPEFLRGLVEFEGPVKKGAAANIPRRQARHLG